MELGPVVRTGRRGQKKRPVRILELYGHAVGSMGIRPDDFWMMTPSEFESVSAAWRVTQNARERGEWERMRTLASICIQPHVKNKLTPRQLLPFPWDDDRQETESLTHDERMRRAEEARRRWG